MHEEIIKAVLETEVDEETKLAESIKKAALSDKATTALKAALRILSGFKDELPTNALDMLAAAAGYPKPEAEAPAPVAAEKQKEDEEEKPAKTEKAKDAGMSPEMEKAMTTQNEALDALKKQNEEIKKQLDGERSLREIAEWTEKAKTDLAHYPGKSSAELGKILKELNDVNPELAKQQFESMKSASNLIASSAVLKTAGLVDGKAEGANPATAWGKIQKLADSVIEKSDDLSMSREKAISNVLNTERGKMLYADYLNEHPAQLGR